MIIKINNFTGEIPRIPAHDLPGNAAQYAKNCVLSHGELRQMPDDFLLHDFTSVVHDLYTDDGLLFFTWPTKTFPQTSPVPNDPYDRVYYLRYNALRVTESARRKTGDEPGTQYRVGVPKPTQLSVNKTTTALPDNVIKYRHTFYWEAGGQKYQETEVSQASGTHFEYSNIPAKEYEIVETEDDGETTKSIRWITPENAVPVIRIEGIDDGDVTVCTLYGGDGLRSTDTSGLRGGVTIEFDLSSTTYGVLVDGETQASEVLVDCNITINLRWAEEDTRAYVVTFVNIWGEEGPPSDPIIERFSAIEKPIITEWGSPESGFQQVTATRIYRTSTGTGGTQFFFVDEVSPDPKTKYQDDIPDSELGEELPSEGWYPPDYGQDLFEAMPNGIFVSASGSTLNFSQPYLPHAWNPLDSINLGHPIVAMKAHETGLVAVTDSGPFLVMGVSPDSMTANRLSVPHAALNESAITRAGNGVIYASHDGLVIVSGATGSIQASMRLWTRADWQELAHTNRKILSLAAHDGKVIIHWSGDDAYVIDIDEASGSLSRCDDLGQASFVLPSTDNVYFAKNSAVYSFQESITSQRRFTWQSKKFILEKPTNFSIVEVDCDNTVKVTVWSSEGGNHTFTANGYGKYRLPSGFRAREWSLKVESQADDAVVRSLTLANSRMELARV